MRKLIKVEAVVAVESEGASAVFDAVEAIEQHVTQVDDNPAVQYLFVHTVGGHFLYDSSCDDPWRCNS